MKSKKILAFAALICLLALSLLCFAGCDDFEEIEAESMKNDQLTNRFFTHILNGEREKAYRMVEGSCTREEFSESYAYFREIFEGAESFEVYLHSRDAFSSDEYEEDEGYHVFCDNVYEVELDNGKYLTVTVSTSSMSADTIDYIDVNETTTFRNITAFVVPFINLSLIALTIGTWVLTVFMIVDCAKRRIKLKVLWMFIIFAAMSYSLSVGGEFYVGGTVGAILDVSSLSADYIYETISFHLVVPAGAIIYFFVRNHLPLKPKKKAEKTAAPAAECAEPVALPLPEETVDAAVEEAVAEEATEAAEEDSASE